MSIRRYAALGLGVLLLVSGSWYFFGPVQEDPVPEGAVFERTLQQLEKRGDMLFEPGAAAPFRGLLIDSYPGGLRKIRIEIAGGKPNGLSRGWYANGQLEVEEHFVAGVASGKRVRWYENGQKRSEAQIENGEITGTFIQWHDNGQKAAEAALVSGEPEGLSRGWYPSGARKSLVEIRGGEVVSREYWEDTVP